MVATRRSKKVETGKGDDPDMKPEEASATPTTSSSKSTTTRKSRRKQKKEELKSRNTGVGLSIDIANDSKGTQNKKILFDEEGGDTEQDSLEGITIDDTKESQNKEEVTNNGIDIDKDEDIDDDVVEEVKGSSARKDVIEQLEAEEKTAQKTQKKKKRKDRRKQALDMKDDKADDDDDLDDSFFAQLESVKAAEEEKRKKIKILAKKKTGKHTTFVFDENEDGRKKTSKVKDFGHNIQVVVLSDPEEDSNDDDFFAVEPMPITEDVLVLSRSKLADGSDRGKKRKKNTPKRPDTSWKRSKKMNLIATSNARFNRRGGKGRPAANFSKASK